MVRKVFGQVVLVLRRTAFSASVERRYAQLSLYSTEQSAQGLNQETAGT